MILKLKTAHNATDSLINHIEAYLQENDNQDCSSFYLKGALDALKTNSRQAKRLDMQAKLNMLLP